MLELLRWTIWSFQSLEVLHSMSKTSLNLFMWITSRRFCPTLRRIRSISTKMEGVFILWIPLWRTLKPAFPARCWPSQFTWRRVQTSTRCIFGEIRTFHRLWRMSCAPCFASCQRALPPNDRSSWWSGFQEWNPTCTSRISSFVISLLPILTSCWSFRIILFLQSILQQKSSFTLRRWKHFSMMLLRNLRSTSWLVLLMRLYLRGYCRERATPDKNE